MWPNPSTHLATPSHPGHLDRLVATLPSQTPGAVPRTPWLIGQMSVLLRHPQVFPVLLLGKYFLQSNENQHGTDPVFNLPNPFNRFGIFEILI